MCANFKPITQDQVKQLQLPHIPFEYSGEAYPTDEIPLLFSHDQTLQWRKVTFGLVPKWAKHTDIAKKTYNARSETLFERPSFAPALYRHQFGVIPASSFFEQKYINERAQRWEIQRKDSQAFYIAALYEICKIGEDIIRSASMLTMDAKHHALMKDFHKPTSDKRSIIIIPEAKLKDWLQLTSQQIKPFIQGFPAEEFTSHNAPRLRSALQNELPYMN